MLAATEVSEFGTSQHVGPSNVVVQGFVIFLSLSQLGSFLARNLLFTTLGLRWTSAPPALVWHVHALPSDHRGRGIGLVTLGLRIIISTAVRIALAFRGVRPSNKYDE